MSFRNNWYFVLSVLMPCKLSLRSKHTLSFNRYFVLSGLLPSVDHCNLFVLTIILIIRTPTFCTILYLKRIKENNENYAAMQMRKWTNNKTSVHLWIIILWFLFYSMHLFWEYICIDLLINLLYVRCCIISIFW